MAGILSWSGLFRFSGTTSIDPRRPGAFADPPLNGEPVTGLEFVDPDIQLGDTAYYVIRAVDSAGNLGPASARASVPPLFPGASLAVRKIQAPANPQSGEQVTYLLVVRNNGQETIERLLVQDAVSSVITGVEATGPPEMAPPAVIPIIGGATRYQWSADGLSFLPNQTWTFTMAGVVGEVCGDRNVTNTAYITGYTTMSSTALVTEVTSFTVLARTTRIVVTKEQYPMAPVSGEVITYRVIVANVGPDRENAWVAEARGASGPARGEGEQSSLDGIGPVGVVRRQQEARRVGRDPADGRTRRRALPFLVS